MKLVIIPAVAVLLTASAVAQNSTSKIDADFSKTAVIALVSAHSEQAKEFKQAIVDAEAAATTPAEEQIVKQLKFYAMMRSITGQTQLMAYQNYLMMHPGAHAEELQADFEKTQPTTAAQRKASDACYTAFKASLHKLDPNIPSECNSK